MTLLTDIEKSVLRMIAGGMTTAEIAFALDIAATEVEQYAEYAISKLGAADIDAAITAAVDAGQISLNL